MNNCKNCDYAILNTPIWCDLRCTEKHRTCTQAEKENGCDKWKEKKTDGKTSTMADQS